MPIYPLPPGASLSARWLRGADSHPPTPSAGAHPPTPSGGGHPPTPSGGGHPPTPSGGGHPPTPSPPKPRAADDDDGRFPAPWAGIDPPWVYADPQALLAQALNRTRAKIVRPPSPTEAPRPGVLVDPLWRWAPEYRGLAIQQALAQRTAIERDKQGLHLLLLQRQPRSGPVAGMTCSSQTVFTLVPPAADFSYDDQIDKVLRAAIEREDRLPEILSQAVDLIPFYNAITGLDTLAATHTAELMHVAWAWATQLLMLLKHEVAERRPVERSGLVQAVIATPGHGSLPSGHATISALWSALLTRLMYTANPSRAHQLDLLARRIAFNRVVAGVHFPMDSWAGYHLGQCLARLFIALAGQGPVPGLCQLPIQPKSELDEHRDPDGSLAVAADQGPAATRVDSLHQLWVRATEELAPLRV